MSDRARSSVRTETRTGSGTSDGVPEAAAAVEDGRDRSSGGATAAGEPARAAGFDDVKPTGGQQSPAQQSPAQQSPAQQSPTATQAVQPVQAGAAPAQAGAAPAPAAPPAAHPVTPLGPATGVRPAAGRGGAVAAAPTGTPPIDSTQAVTVPPASARPVDATRAPAGRATEQARESGGRPEGGARPTGKRGAGRGPRRARLQLRHIDTWSALKISLVVSIALFFVWMVAVAVLYGVLGGLGVFDTLNDLIGQLSTASGSGGGGGDVITAGVVFWSAAVIGAVNIVLLTALCTIAAFVYNLCSDLVGGLEVTLAERE